MVRQHLRRLKYKLRGALLEARAKGVGLHSLLPKFGRKQEHKKNDVVEKRHHTAIPHEEKSGKSEGHRLVGKEGHKTQISLFHPYRREPLWGSFSHELQRHGLPPLSLSLVLAFFFIGALLAIFSIGILAFEPKNVDVMIAVQALNGNVLKDAAIYLTTPGGALPAYSATTQSDGLALFPQLPVTGKFLIHAEKDGRRIEVDDREVKVPLPAGRKEIIIVKKAVS